MNKAQTATLRAGQPNAVAAKDPGLVREMNEDQFWRAPDDLDPQLAERKGYLYLIADGMGGYEGGEVASEITVRTVREHYYADQNTNITVSLADAIEAAEQAIRAEKTTNPQYAQMGSTLVAAVVHGKQLCVANVGDSRCYRLRNNELKQLTHDHSWVAEQLAAGVLTDEEARNHPYRSSITRGLGQDQIPHQPDIHTHNWQPGDRILLCSDGLWEMVPDEKITVLLAKQNVRDAVISLIQAAKDGGGEDNISVLIAANEDPPKNRATVLLPLLIVLTIAAVVIGGVVFTTASNNVLPTPGTNDMEVGPMNRMDRIPTSTLVPDLLSPQVIENLPSVTQTGNPVEGVVPTSTQTIVSPADTPVPQTTHVTPSAVYISVTAVPDVAQCVTLPIGQENWVGVSEDQIHTQDAILWKGDHIETINPLQLQQFVGQPVMPTFVMTVTGVQDHGPVELRVCLVTDQSSGGCSLSGPLSKLRSNIHNWSGPFDLDFNFVEAEIDPSQTRLRIAVVGNTQSITLTQVVYCPGN